jgi:hypothetical protein
METNVIYLSDASFDHQTKEAGLGIKNLSTGLCHSLYLHASTPHEAEEFALLEAINHAIANHHRNCIFVYDNINIDTQSIEMFYSKMFEKIQFLWCKRDYLAEVDRLAASVRLKHSKNVNWTKLILSHASTISDEELVSTLMPLTRGETYGYLCAITGTAPMVRGYPNNMKEVNEKIIALLMYAGSARLYKQLSERFGKVKCYKQKFYDELLISANFTMGWFEEAAHECRALRSAA